MPKSTRFSLGLRSTFSRCKFLCDFLSRLLMDRIHVVVGFELRIALRRSIHLVKYLHLMALSPDYGLPTWTWLLLVKVWLEGLILILLNLDSDGADRWQWCRRLSICAGYSRPINHAIGLYRSRLKSIDRLLTLRLDQVLSRTCLISFFKLLLTLILLPSGWFTALSLFIEKSLRANYCWILTIHLLYLGNSENVLGGDISIFSHYCFPLLCIYVCLKTRHGLLFVRRLVGIEVLCTYRA